MLRTSTGIGVVPEGFRLDWKGGTGVWQYIEKRQDRLSGSGEWAAIFTNEPATPIATNVVLPGETNRALFYRIRAIRP
jgi:hypothetical protein